MLFTYWPYSHGNQSPYKEENPFNIVFLTCVMLYDQTFSLLSPEIPSHYSRQPISSRDSACVSGSKTSAKWGWKRRKKFVKAWFEMYKGGETLEKHNSWNAVKKKEEVHDILCLTLFFLHGHLRCYWQTQTCSLFVVWVAVRGVTWGNCIGMRTSPFHLLIR